MVAPESNAPCAAGDHCTHPTSPGIVKLTGENYSPHKCLECNKPIHCAIFCGKSVYELKGNFDSSLLSINGQHIFTTTSDENGMTVCHMCLFRLRPTEMPALPALPAIVDEQRGVFPCAANTLCREDDDLIYPTTTTCCCINCNGTAHLGCVEDFKLQTPVELDKAILMKDFLPAARKRITGLASDKSIMFCIKCQAVMLLNRTVPKAPTKAKRSLVPKNDIRIMLRQIAVYHALEFVFTEQIKSSVKLCPEVIGQKFNILVLYLFSIPWYPTLTRGEKRLAKNQILDSYLFDIPLEFGGLKCNGQPTNFLLPFSALGSFFLFHI